MGLLDSVLGNVLGGALGGAIGGGGRGGGGGADILMKVIGGLMAQGGQGGGGGGNGGGNGGGLGGLLGQLTQGGLGDAVQSWVGTGQNMPVSADQLQSALGGDQVSALAQQAGLSTGDLMGQLAHMLPQVVDRMTPNGQMPAAGADITGMLGGLLGGLMKR